MYPKQSSRDIYPNASHITGLVSCTDCKTTSFYKYIVFHLSENLFYGIQIWIVKWQETLMAQE